MIAENLQKLLADRGLTMDVVLVDVPPDLRHKEVDTIFSIEDKYYLKASSFSELEQACNAAAADLGESVLNVYAMPYVSLICCRSLLEIFSDDDGLCGDVRIHILNQEFVKNRLKILKSLSPLLEKRMEISAELGKFLKNNPLPSTNAVDDVLKSHGLVLQRMLVSTSENVKAASRDVLSTDSDLYIETVLYDARKSHAEILQKTVDKLEVMSDDINNIFTGYIIISDTRTDLCNSGEEDSKASCFDLGHPKNDGEKEPLVTRKADLLASGVHLVQDAENKNRDAHVKLDDTVKTYSVPTPEDFPAYMLMELPDCLRLASNHEVIQDGEHFRMRVRDFNEFENFCETKGLTIEGGVLKVHAMQDISLRSCSQLRDCYIDNSGRCKGVGFEICNMDFILERASVIDCHLNILIKANSDAMVCLRKRLKAVPSTPDDKTIEILLSGCQGATDRLICAMLAEGLDSHDTIKQLKPETHELLFMEDAHCAICDDKSEGTLSLELITKMKTYKEGLDKLYSEISTVQEQRLSLLRTKGQFALSQCLWRARKDLIGILNWAIDKLVEENEYLIRLYDKHIIAGTTASRDASKVGSPR